MNIALWIVQGLLAAMFLIVGGLKAFAYERYKKMAEGKSPAQEKAKTPELTRGLVTFIGVSEIAGTVGLILPAATGIVPVLTPLAALGLGVIMLLAVGFHSRRKEPVAVPAVLLALSVFVVVGRF
jgi:uncharacterized membrane protein YphA (DoxX/SURF4 family)